MLCSMSNVSQCYTIIMVQPFVTVKYECVLLLFPHHLSFRSHFLAMYPVRATRFHTRMWPASTLALDVQVTAFKNLKLCVCVCVCVYVCVYFSGLRYNSVGISRIRHVHGKVAGKRAHGKVFCHQSLLRGCTVPALAWRNWREKRLTLVQPDIWTELSEYKSRTLTMHQPVCSFVDKMAMFRSNVLLPYSKYLKTATLQFLIRIQCSQYVHTSHIVE